MPEVSAGGGGCRCPGAPLPPPGPARPSPTASPCAAAAAGPAGGGLPGAAARGKAGFAPLAGGAGQRAPGRGAAAVLRGAAPLARAPFPGAGGAGGVRARLWKLATRDPSGAPGALPSRGPAAVRGRCGGRAACPGALGGEKAAGVAAEPGGRAGPGRRCPRRREAGGCRGGRPLCWGCPPGPAAPGSWKRGCSKKAQLFRLDFQRRR